jgi:hypothetical protein
MLRAWEDLTEAELATIRERLLRDVDPDVVAEDRRRRDAAAARWGTPRRCQTNEVHPGLGCCLYCSADSGEPCRAERAR